MRQFSDHCAAHSKSHSDTKEMPPLLGAIPSIVVYISLASRLN